MWTLFYLNFPIPIGRQSIFFRAEGIPSKKSAAIYIHLSSSTFPYVMNGFAILMPIVWIYWLLMSVLTNSIDAIQSHIYDPPLTSCFVQISSSPSLLSSLTLPSIVWRVEYEYLQIPQIEQNCQTIGEVLISRLKNILQGLLLTFTCVLWEPKSTLDLYSRELTSHRQVATSGSWFDVRRAPERLTQVQECQIVQYFRTRFQLLLAKWSIVAHSIPNIFCYWSDGWFGISGDPQRASCDLSDFLQYFVNHLAELAETLS